MERINPLKETNVTPHEKNEKPHSRRNRRNILIGVCLLVGIILVLFIVQPSILGLGVYQDDETGINNTKLSVEEQINLLSQQLEESNTQITAELEGRDAKITADLLQSLETKLDELDQLAECLDQKSSLSTENEMYEIKIDSLEEQLNKNNADLQETLDEKDDKIIELEAELETIEDSYKELIAKMANNICCKKKVDDSSINSYTIEGDNLVCSGSGENPLSCPS